MKHLPENGWQPSVLTVDEDSFSHQDPSLLADVDPAMRVIKTAANDPFTLYRRFLGKKSDAPLVASETISTENTDWRHRLAIWVRMNLFVPDARIGWNLSAIPGGRRAIQQERPDAIVSIGPPHSSHLIGGKLSREFGIPHYPVLIDPWTDIVYYRGFSRSALTKAWDQHLERRTMEQARRVIFVTNSAREQYFVKYPWMEKKSDVLYWGYNEESFAGVRKRSDADVILHAGNIFDYQDPKGLWRAIRQEIDRGRTLRLRFIGTVSPGIKASVAAAGLEPYTDYRGFLPYPEVVQEMMDASFLLVCATEKRHVPGKLFEYLRTGNRIIAFGDDNAEVEQLLGVSRSGLLFPYNEPGTGLLDRVQALTPDAAAVRHHSRASIAAGLAKILDSSAFSPM